VTFNFGTADPLVQFPSYASEGNIFLSYQVIDEDTGLPFYLSDNSEFVQTVTSNTIVNIKIISKNELDVGTYNLAMVATLAGTNTHTK